MMGRAFPRRPCPTFWIGGEEVTAVVRPHCMLHSRRRFRLVAIQVEVLYNGIETIALIDRAYRPSTSG